jgi:hypothetical protein
VAIFVAHHALLAERHQDLFDMAPDVCSINVIAARFLGCGMLGIADLPIIIVILGRSLGGRRIRVGKWVGFSALSTSRCFAAPSLSNQSSAIYFATIEPVRFLQAIDAVLAGGLLANGPPSSRACDAGDGGASEVPAWAGASPTCAPVVRPDSLLEATFPVASANR